MAEELKTLEQGYDDLATALRAKQDWQRKVLDVIGPLAPGESLDVAVERIRLLLWLHAEAVHEKAVAYGLMETVNESAIRAVDVARAQTADLHARKVKVESSRRAWAEEAMRLEMEAETRHCSGSSTCPADVHHERCFYRDAGFCCDEPRPTVDAGEPDENVTTCGNCGEDMDEDMLDRLRYRPAVEGSVLPDGDQP